MGHSYEQIKDFRRQSKTLAVHRLLSEKNSTFVGDGLLAGESVAVIKKATRGRPKKVQEVEVAATGSVPTKKRRGRPKGSKNKKKKLGRPRKTARVAAPVVAPATTTTPAAATGPKKRGRKKGNPNEKEIAVMKCLNGPGRGRFKAYKIKEIAESCFPNVDQTEACLWVRTSLRRPVNEKWVEKAARGEYRMNLDGRSALKSLTG